MTSDKKKCTKCGKVKSLDEFHAEGKAKSGKRPDCAACHNAAQHTPAARARGRRYDAKRRVLHADRLRARSAASQAARSGKLMPQPCLVCGTLKDLQKHHPDYAAPLTVVWLCRKHHADLHHRERMAAKLRAGIS
jgi:hypothetical protein